MLDDDDEPIKDVIAAGLQSLVEGNKNPLSEYNEAFRNLQTRRKMKPVIPGSAKEKTRATELTEDSDTITSHTAMDVPQQQEGASELAASRIDFDSEALAEDSDAVGILENEGPAEFAFATMGADDVALDMDTEFGYITEDESSSESEGDLNDEMS